MRVGLRQLSVSDDPAANPPVTLGLVERAADAGAVVVLTPEATTCLSGRRSHQRAVLCHEAGDPMLAGLREAAARRGLWLLIGSRALKTGDADGRFANRSVLIDPSGGIAARHDRPHMVDVDVSATGTCRESAGLRPGARAVPAGTPFARTAMTVCHDVRFPRHDRALAQAGAEVLTVPAAVSPVTGAAHWESLLRARAIECGARVLAPAQTGALAAQAGRARRTPRRAPRRAPRRKDGHSLVVAPWGEVGAGGGTEPGTVLAGIDRAAVAVARRRVPSLSHDRPFEVPAGAGPSDADARLRRA